MRREAEGTGRGHLRRNAVIELLLLRRALFRHRPHEDRLLGERLSGRFVEALVVGGPRHQRKREIVDLLHAAHELAERRALRPDDDGVDPRGFALVELRGHVRVVHAEFLVADRLEALQIPNS